MATVTLPDLYIHLASSPATYVTATLDGLVEKSSIAARVGRYAGGRYRAITRPGQFEAYTITLNMAPRATVDQLRSWQGSLLMYRDPRGRVFWGICPEIPITEIGGVIDDIADLAFDVQAITYSIAV